MTRAKFGTSTERTVETSINTDGRFKSAGVLAVVHFRASPTVKRDYDDLFVADERSDETTIGFVLRYAIDLRDTRVLRLVEITSYRLFH